MMKKLNRIIALCLALATLSLAGGCNNASNKADDNTVVWYIQKPIENLENQESVEAEFNKLIGEKLDAKLHFNMIDVASWDQKTKLLGASGDGVDLIFTSHWTNKLVDNVRNGSFMPLDDLLEKYGQDILKKVDPRAWDAVRFDGKIMAIPSQTPYSSPRSIVFKKDLVEKYNFDYKNAKTLKDIEPFLAQIKANEPDMIPLLVTAKDDPIAWYDDLDTIGGGVYYDITDKKLVTRYSEEDTYKLDYTRTTYDFYKKGYIAKDALTKTEYTSEAKSGKYAVMHQAGSATEDGSKSTSLYGYDCVETLVLYPRISTNSLMDCSTAFSVNCKNPELAMQVLNLIWADPKISNTIAYGVEGQDYVVVDGAGTDNPTIKTNEGSNQKWAIWHNTIGPLWDQWDSNWNTRESLQKMQEDNQKAEASPLVGFIFDPTPVVTEYAAVNSVLGEVDSVFRTGSMNDYDSYLEETRARLEAAGISKVKDEVQKQLDAWLATK